MPIDADWYLAVFERRDVIEEMLPDKLDISGWYLRKTLRLFSKCNVALNEWLGSPIEYCAAPGFRAELAGLMPAYFNPIAATHHYRRMAEQALPRVSRSAASASRSCSMRCAHCWRAAGLLTRSRNRRPNLPTRRARMGIGRRASVDRYSIARKVRAIEGAPARCRGAHRGVAARAEAYKAARKRSIPTPRARPSLDRGCRSRLTPRLTGSASPPARPRSCRCARRRT